MLLLVGSETTHERSGNTYRQREAGRFAGFGLMFDISFSNRQACGGTPSTPFFFDKQSAVVMLFPDHLPLEILSQSDRPLPPLRKIAVQIGSGRYGSGSRVASR